mmetsp:Transcript_70056/g.204968  ORF Transcript_70056/g.204968 Transcript_70056/m.204968 type:complete len:415 (-) Transcript_70056:231-1475(-)
MTERELAEAIEFIPDRLYWVAVHTVPRNTQKSHYFCIDNELVYEPFFADFGPLNLSMVYRYCKMLEAKLLDPGLADKRIIHFCSHDPKQRANAACLMCAYQVAALGKTVEMAYEPFCAIYPPFLPFRDATCGVCTFQLTITDCLKGLEESIKHRWFDLNRFDSESYDFYEKVENGDMNWIIPGKFLAFAGPSTTSFDAEGFPAFTPEDYVPVFLQAGIRLAVRLNKPCYDRRRFTEKGIRHVDLYFRDGSCPCRSIITKFLHVTENETGAVAVHCKAGLGRTGTLIGLYAMKNHFIPARLFIAWNRLCRPGSVLGPQQQFLLSMEADMFQAGIAALGPRWSPHMLPDATDGALAQQASALQIQYDNKSENYGGDDGQGERLCSAKRNMQGAEVMKVPAVPNVRQHVYTERPMAR